MLTILRLRYQRRYRRDIFLRYPLLRAVLLCHLWSSICVDATVLDDWSADRTRRRARQVLPPLLEPLRRALRPPPLIAVQHVFGLKRPSVGRVQPSECRASRVRVLGDWLRRGQIC